MNQPEEDTLIVWSALAVVFGVSFGIGTSAGVRSGASGAQIAPPMTPVYVYRRISSDDAVAPRFESLVYPEPGRARGGSVPAVDVKERGGPN